MICSACGKQFTLGGDNYTLTCATQLPQTLCIECSEAIDKVIEQIAEESENEPESTGDPNERDLYREWKDEQIMKELGYD